MIDIAKSNRARRFPMTHVLYANLYFEKISTSDDYEKDLSRVDSRRVEAKTITRRRNEEM